MASIKFGKAAERAWKDAVAEGGPVYSWNWPTIGGAVVIVGVFLFFAAKRIA